MNQSAERGWAAGYCSCPGLSSYEQTSGGWGQGISLPAIQSGVISAKYHSFWGGTVRDTSHMFMAVAKIRLACLWKTKISLTFPVFHMTALSAWVLLEKSQGDHELLFALQIMTIRACCHYLAGTALYRPTCPGIFLLTGCTLAAFTLPFSLPSPTYLSWWKKVSDKWFKMDSGTKEDFFYWLLDFSSTCWFQTNFLITLESFTTLWQWSSPRQV